MFSLIQIRSLWKLALNFDVCNWIFRQISLSVKKMSLFLVFHHFAQSLTQNPWRIMVGWCWDICRAWYHLQFRLWIHHFGCLDHKLRSLEVGTKLSKFSNLVKILNFSRLPLLQVILISWSILVQMHQWTIFTQNIGHDTWYLKKFQFCPLCTRWNLIGETLIFNCA